MLPLFFAPPPLIAPWPRLSPGGTIAGVLFREKSVLFVSFHSVVNRYLPRGSRVPIPVRSSEPGHTFGFPSLC